MEPYITLEQILNARERRVSHQQELLDRYHKPLISFTMNIAGPIKNNPLIYRGFQLGLRCLKGQLSANKILCLHFDEINEPTGCEAYFVLDASPLTLKKITADLEDSSNLGRLFDMDVLKENGEKVGREELGLSPRRCLICDNSARICGRSRAHKVAELQEKTTAILENALLEADVKEIAVLAQRALLYEVATSPKPGLVDRFTSGSHKDMDVFTFMDSASALFPYFESCARIGIETANDSAKETFYRIRQEGKKAESDMLSATNGVNTHKGAIFSMGILCGAVGRISPDLRKDTSLVLEECKKMTEGIVSSDFAGLNEENAVTVGQKLYLHHKISGVRGQAEAGFPAVKEQGLPKLKEGLARGLSLNEAGCATLLTLMVSVADTNLIARSNIKTQEQIVSEVTSLLAGMPFPDQQTLLDLDAKFIHQNLSPGGSADLLAICYFLYFLETME